MRILVDIPEAWAKKITELARNRGVSEKELVSRAIFTYESLCRELLVSGAKVSITDREDKVLKDVILA